MKRRLEEEIMDDVSGVDAYAAADFSGVNAAFVELVLDSGNISPSARILDLGCGPADIPIRLATAMPGVTVTAVDASEPMLVQARLAINAAGLIGRVETMLATLTDPRINSEYDLLISNSLVHHLPDPSLFWEVGIRTIRPGGALFVMDLLRPESTREAEALVATYAKHEPERLRKDFYNSLLAAFTLSEIRSQLVSAGLHYLEPKQISDRHWLVSGATDQG